MKNPVAKHAHKFNRANVMVDRKKESKKSGSEQDQAWNSLGEYEHSIIREHYESGELYALNRYCTCVLHMTTSQYQNILMSLNDGVS